MSSMLARTHTHRRCCREKRSGYDEDGRRDGGREKEREKEDGEERRHYVPIMLLSAV